MATNREWLYSLDVADLADWFDAEYKPIVRCEDCTHFHEWEALRVEGFKCTRVVAPFEVEPDGFCSWAERRQS